MNSCKSKYDWGINHREGRHMQIRVGFRYCFRLLDCREFKSWQALQRTLGFSQHLLGVCKQICKLSASAKTGLMGVGVGHLSQ